MLHSSTNEHSVSKGLNEGAYSHRALDGVEVGVALSCKKRCEYLQRFATLESAFRRPGVRRRWKEKLSSLTFKYETLLGYESPQYVTCPLPGTCE